MMFFASKNLRLAAFGPVLCLAACQTDLPDAAHTGAAGAAEVASVDSSDSIEAAASENLAPPRCRGSIEFRTATGDPFEAGGAQRAVIAIVSATSDAPEIRFTELRFRVHGPHLIRSAYLSVETTAGDRTAGTLDFIATSDSDSDVLDFNIDYSLERRSAASFPPFVLSADLADLSAHDEQRLQATLEYAKATGLVCTDNLPIECHPVRIQGSSDPLPVLGTQ